MTRRLFAFLFALGLCLSTWSARAQSKSSVQVVAIASEDAFEQAQALTIALKRAVSRAEGWTLSKGDFSLEVMTAAMGCPIPPDATCQKKIADKVGTNRYVWGTLAKSGKKEVTAILRLWENGSQKRDTQLKYASNLTDPSDDTLLNIAADAFAKLTGEPTGVVVVTAGSVNGKVFVDGQEAGTVTDGRTELSLTSGEHKIVVKAPGYNDAMGTVTVRAGSSAEIALNPTPAGGEKKEPDATQDTGGGGSGKMIGYVGVGLGSALALAGGYFWLQSFLETKDSDYAKYRESVPDKEGVTPCDQAKVEKRQDIIDLCDRNQSHKTLARILTPVGVTIAGVGTYFLVTSGDQKTEKSATRRRAPKVQPFVGFGPRGGAVSVNVAF
jgi:hypothetical protein